MNNRSKLHFDLHAPAKERGAAPESTGAYFVIQRLLGDVLIAQIKRALSLDPRDPIRLRAAIITTPTPHIAIVLEYSSMDIAEKERAQALHARIAANIPDHWDLESVQTLLARLKPYQAEEQAQSILASLIAKLDVTLPQFAAAEEQAA